MDFVPHQLVGKFLILAMNLMDVAWFSRSLIICGQLIQLINWIIFGQLIKTMWHVLSHWNVAHGNVGLSKGPWYRESFPKKHWDSIENVRGKNNLLGWLKICNWTIVFIFSLRLLQDNLFLRQKLPLDVSFYRCVCICFKEMSSVKSWCNCPDWK